MFPEILQVIQEFGAIGGADRVAWELAQAFNRVGLINGVVTSAAFDASGTSWTLRSVPVSDVEGVGDQAETGQPCYFAKFSEGYRLFPIPDGVYTIRFTGHVRLGAPATDADTSAWVDEAYDLIASYAKRYLALHRLKDTALKAAMDVAVGEASASLKGLATTMAGTGVVRAYDL